MKMSATYLINTADFEISSASCNPSQPRSAALSIRGLGKRVKSTTDDVCRDWAGLQTPGTWENPDQDQAYSLMEPADEKSVELQESTQRVSDALEIYADELESIKTRLEDLETEANAFREEAIAGYAPQERSDRFYGSESHASNAYEANTPWYEVPDAVRTNETLLARYGIIVADLSEAATHCANKIRGEMHVAVRPSFEAEELKSINEELGVPYWDGSGEEVERGLWQTPANILYWGYGEPIEGYLTLTLGYDPTKDFRTKEAWGNKELRKEAWLGYADVGNAILTLPAAMWNYERTGRAAGTREEQEYLEKRAKVDNLVGGFFLYDADAASKGGNAYSRWDDPVAASVVVAGGFLAPSAKLPKKAGTDRDPVGQIMENGGFKARMLKVSAGTADLMVPSGSYLVTGGVRARSFVSDTLDRIEHSHKIIEDFDKKSGPAPLPEPKATVPAKDAPRRYTPDDVERALDEAPKNEAGIPLDHRNGRPLVLEDSAGNRGWEMRFDAESGKFVAENRSLSGSGFEAKGEPGSYGYDANGDRLPYANHRPGYTDAQLKETWSWAVSDQQRAIAAGELDLPKTGENQLWVKVDPDAPRTGEVIESNGATWRKVEWEPGQSRSGKWDMSFNAYGGYEALRNDYLSGLISKDEFLQEFRDPDNWQVKDPGRNRARVDD